MNKIRLSDRLRYYFDDTMSRGVVALIIWLFILLTAMIFFIATIVLATGMLPSPENGVSPLGFGEILWMILMRVIDPGTVTGDSGNRLFLFTMFVATMGGIFVFSTLIGILNSGIARKLEELRKGRSLVIEQNHTVILGWSSQVYTILAELVVANESCRSSCVAILAEEDKVEMEDEIRARIPDSKRTRIVCRTGSPIDLTDLHIVNPDTARSIIVLSPENDNPDSDVIKTILAITKNLSRRTKAYHIVAEIKNARNVGIAQTIGRNEVELVLTCRVISRIIAQTCRQPGLSTVYSELLNFRGAEIYFKEEPALVGKTFAEVILAYEQSSVIGIHHHDGDVLLLPPMDMVVVPGDHIIAITDDDSTFRLSASTTYHIDMDMVQGAHVRQPIKPERTLILGWNRHAPLIINELDNYVCPGSEIMLVGYPDEAKIELNRQCSHLRNQTISFRQGDCTDRHALEELEVTTYEHVVVLSPSYTPDIQQADARTLITLLHLREIADKNNHTFSIVSEMKDSRNRTLAEVARVDDFIVSSQLVSLMLAQISENKQLADVFADLFGAEKAEIYLKPITNYIQIGKPTTFYTIVHAAQERGEVAIGYRLHAYANDVTHAYGICVNPAKSKQVAFSELDSVIVLSDDRFV